MRYMAHLESWPGDPASDWKSKIYRVEHIVSDKKADFDDDLASAIVGDVVAVADADSGFFVYCRSRGILVYSGPEAREVVDNSPMTGVVARKVAMTPLEYRIHFAKVRDIQSNLAKLRERITMVVRTRSGRGKGRLTIGGNDARNITPGAMSKQKANQVFDRSIGHRWLGQELEFQMAYELSLAPGKKFDIVERHMVRVDDMELDFIERAFVKIHCKSPFGQGCRIDVSADSPTTFDDLEDDPSPEGRLVMVPEDRSGYPSASSYVITPCSWPATNMLSDVVAFLRTVDRDDQGEAGAVG